MAKQFQFFADGKHLKTMSSRYKPVFKKEMISSEGKRLNLKEKFEAEWALFVFNTRAENIHLYEFIKNQKPKDRYIVVNFFGEEYYEFRLTNNISIKVGSKLFNNFNPESQASKITRNY